MRFKIFVYLIISLFSVCILSTYIKKANAAETKPPGLGQCHWIGGPIGSFDSLRWGYSESQPFAFKDGEGDSWASIESQKGIYNFSQQRGAVNYVKNKNKTIWLDIQVAGQVNKEQNVPKWALDEGIEMYETNCGDPNNDRYWVKYKMSDISSVWGNSKYMDVTEAVKYTGDNEEQMVKFPVKLPAFWDPKFQDYYIKALAAQKKEFQKDIDGGTVTAINLMSGGHYGESNIQPKCPGWGGVTCTPDVLNPACPVIKSMAKFKGRTPEEIAKKGNCDPKNTIPGNTPIICTQEPCPTEYGSYCYVFDDYFIQSMKQLISREVELFNGLPIVWQAGSGLSGTGRTTKVLENWMAATYGSRVWMKFNGWGPQDKFFYTRNFNQFGNTTRHGFECGVPYAFSRSYWVNNNGAATWCTNSAPDPKPPECQNPIDPDKVARLAIATAVKTSMLEDRSSYLCMQSDFFDSAPIDRGNGKMGNEYYFNPNDNTQNCDNSEINASTYGVGFCPGYLNYVFSQADAPVPPPPVPTSYPNPTSPPNATNTPTPTGSVPLSCASCPSGKIAKNKGNANCDSTVNNDDYLLWEEIYVKTVKNIFVSEEDKSKVDFDCSITDITHQLDLVDFEIWRRYAY